MLEAGWFSNMVFVGNYQFDLAALVSRVGLVISLLLLGIFAVGWQLDRLAVRERDLEQKLQAESNRRFLRRLDHELKNPLTIIRLGVVNLKQSPNLTPEQTSSLDRIGQQVQRLQTLVEDLRWLTELEEGKLEQAVVNLIDNAIKFSDDGSTILIKAVQMNDQISISVRDHGCGRDKEHLPRLFERFYRVDKARSRQMGGTGLGLAIVKHIAQAHGGEVSVESTPGKGSTFSIHLPIV